MNSSTGYVPTISRLDVTLRAKIGGVSNAPEKNVTFFLDEQQTTKSI